MQGFGFGQPPFLLSAEGKGATKILGEIKDILKQRLNRFYNRQSTKKQTSV